MAGASAVELALIAELVGPAPGVHPRSSRSLCASDCSTGSRPRCGVGYRGPSICWPRATGQGVSRCAPPLDRAVGALRPGRRLSRPWFWRQWTIACWCSTLGAPARASHVSTAPTPWSLDASTAAAGPQRSSSTGGDDRSRKQEPCGTSSPALPLMGMARRAIEIGAEYATERRAFGSPIGVLSGRRPPLGRLGDRYRRRPAPGASGRLAARPRASWRRRRSSPSLVAGFCGSAATRATARAVHIHGGYGAALEYDIQLFHQRARARGALIGDPTSTSDPLGPSCRAPRSETV